MTQWTEQFKSHKVWQLLQNLGPVIDDAIKREGIEPISIEVLARLKAVLTFTGRRISGADPYLFHLAPLDNLSNSLESLIQEVQHFIANGNAGHITNASAHADAVLGYLAQLNIPLTTEDFIAAKDAAESYRSGLEKVLSDVKNAATPIQGEVDSLRTRLSELSSELSAERTRLTMISTDFQTQFSTTQESRSQEFANAQKERQDRFTDLQAQFSTAQEARSQEFANAQKERQDRFITLFTDYTQKLGEQNTEFTRQREDIARLHKEELEILKKQFVAEATGLHEEILNRKAEVEKLVGVIGNLGVTSGYLTTANEAKVTVRVWQVVTVLSMLGLIILAYCAFLPLVEGGFTWSGFAGRVFVSLTVGVLAAYAASQADKYQKIERQNRRLALELEAIGPYIAPLPQDKQEQFRLTIGDRSFGHGDGPYSGLDAKSPASMLDLIQSKEFRSLITDIIKAAKP